MTRRPPTTDLVRIDDLVFPRERAMIIGVFTGVAIGIGNALLGVIFPSWPAALGLLVLALLLVLVLHEGLHGLAGRLLGYDPIFGVQRPWSSQPSRRRCGATTSLPSRWHRWGPPQDDHGPTIH